MGYMRTYVSVDLDAIRENVCHIREKLDQEGCPATSIAAVVKTDGYGHGAVPIAKKIADLVDCYCVATVEEALDLREAGLKHTILILGYTSFEECETLIANDISLTIFHKENAILAASIAKKLNKTAKIHIALNTGMTRIGFMPDEESADLVLEISKMEGLQIEGIFSHLCCADQFDQSYSKMQWERFDEFVTRLEKRGLSIPIKHLCNSAGIMEFDHHRYDMVRAGIILYGLYPSDEVHFENLSLVPALTWKAHVVHLMDVEAGVGISYGATYVTKEPRKIATIGIGYGDGYPRSLSNQGAVLIHGKRAPIVGRVCMDQMMVDVTDIDVVCLEDEVTLIGRDGSEEISMEEIARLTGTINYEVACNISKRVPRIICNKFS